MSGQNKQPGGSPKPQSSGHGQAHYYIRSSKVIKMEAKGGVLEGPEPSSSNDMDDKLDANLSKFLQSSSTSNSSDVVPWDPAQKALAIPDVLKSVFKHLDKTTVQGLSEVCPTWSEEVATAFRHPVIQVSNSSSLALMDNLQKFPDLHRIQVMIDGEDENELDKVLETVRGVRPCWWEWKSRLELHFHIRSDRNLDKCTLVLLEIVKRAKSLKELTYYSCADDENEIRRFLNGFLGTEGLAVNERFKQTLEYLSIEGVEFDTDWKYFKILRKLKLSKLKTLELRIMDFGDELALWISDLSSSLESLCLQSFCEEHTLDADFEFLTEMEKLKYLRIEGDALGSAQLQDNIILYLMERLPNLVTLVLDTLTSTGVRTEDYLSENFSLLSYPKLKTLEITFKPAEEENRPRRFHDDDDDGRPFYAFRQLDCELNEYIPKLFPNLKVLKIPVYSKHNFLACVHDLKDMGIEELDLILMTLDKLETKKDLSKSKKKGRKKKKKLKSSEESNTPSFNNWKNLRKLTLQQKAGQTTGDLTPTELYNIPMEEVLPKKLTSLRLAFQAFHTSSNNVFVLTFLLKVLQGLPGLMHCTLDNCEVVQDGNKMELSEVRDVLRKDPLLHPYFHFGGI